MTRRRVRLVALLACTLLVAIPAGGALTGCSRAVEEAAPGGGVDRAIKAAVEMSLKTDPRTQSSQITVAVSGRVVTLTGEVKDGEAKLAAVELTRKMPDVTDVKDDLTVAPGGLP